MRDETRKLASSVMGAAAACAGAVVGLTPSARAGLMMDLRAVAINGQPLPPGFDAKHVDVPAPGDTITLDLFAVVTGTNGVNDEMVSLAHGSLLSSGAVLGNFAGGTVAPFNQSGSQNGSVQDIDGDTDLDIGVTPNGGTPVTGYFAARSNTAQAGTPISANSSEIRVGSFAWTHTGGMGDFFLNFVRRANASGGNITTAAVWFEDGLAKNAIVGSYSVGAPVTRAPEPTAAVTVGALTSLGLLSRRRTNVCAEK